jgi:hypothetical protein
MEIVKVDFLPLSVGCLVVPFNIELRCPARMRKAGGVAAASYLFDEGYLCLLSLARVDTLE